MSESEPTRVVSERETLTARMVNEFVYCPRLFYYEFVDGIFVANADTLHGTFEHRRVDRGTGKLPKSSAKKAEQPKPDQEAPTNDENIAADEESIHSRSVQLGSDRLGVAAKLDLVEAEVDEKGAAHLTSPVEYKSGKPRETAEGIEIWDADRIQLGLQMWLLRENGYACNEGVLYYKETKQRVRLPWNAELERWVEAQVAGARKCAAGPRPLPLMDSPKCPRCSLVTVCLPDETNWLRERIGEGEPVEPPGAEMEESPGTGDNPEPQRHPPPPRPPRKAGTEDAALLSRGKLRRSRNGEAAPNAPELRRLIAVRDDRRAIYLNTPGLWVGMRDRVLTFKDKEQTLDPVRVQDVNHLALFGNIQLSTQAIHTLAELEIPITYFSMGGYFHAVTHGHGLKNVVTRIEQFRAAGEPAVCLALAKRIIGGKIRNQRTQLMRNHIERPDAALRRLQQAQVDVEGAESLSALLGIEGAAAALYFEHFGGMLRPRQIEGQAKRADDEAWSFDFTNRNRRPPRDPVNAMLSLAYSLLAKDFTIAAYSVGFDPYVGFYHQPRHGRPALALDLMEEFRALVADSAVTTAINNGSVTTRDFVRAGDAVNLTPAGRKAFFEVYERRITSSVRHPVFGYEVSYRRAFELQYRLLARALSGELAHYVPFRTR